MFTINAITVDVEDWAQSTLNPEYPLSSRFVESTREMLELFERHRVKATFFVLGLAAQKAPGLVREIHRRGHEIQSHGFGHRSLFSLTRSELKADLERSKKLLEDTVGEAVTGYRAPSFSVTTETLWALDVIFECGFTFDSSIFPVKTARYGIDGAPRVPHWLETPAGNRLLELPVASARLLGRTLPGGGGGYLRLLPYALTQCGVRQLNRSGHPATLYLHPYELDVREMLEVRGVPWMLRAQQGLGRSGVAGKLNRLLAEFEFTTVTRAMASCGDLPRFRH
ncbi:MAG TPA: DUF3473 domain-containing protein [Polyangiaceae bacterium]|nr:DUF3473 domain-containing protein [Polyangiaceae bacterium]